MNEYCQKIYGWTDSVKYAEEYIEKLGLCTKEELRKRTLMEGNPSVISHKYRAEHDILYFLQNVCYIKMSDLAIAPIKMTPQFLIASLLFEAERPFILLGNRQTGNTTFLLTLNLWQMITERKPIAMFFNNKTIARQKRKEYIDNIVYPTVKLNTEWLFSKDDELSDYYGLFYYVLERENPIKFTNDISGISLVDWIPGIINNDPEIFKKIIINKNLSGIISRDISWNDEKYHYIGIQNPKILDMIEHNVTLVDIQKETMLTSIKYNTVFIR